MSIVSGLYDALQAGANLAQTQATTADTQALAGARINALQMDMLQRQMLMRAYGLDPTTGRSINPTGPQNPLLNFLSGPGPGGPQQQQQTTNVDPNYPTSGPLSDIGGSIQGLDRQIQYNQYMAGLFGPVNPTLAEKYATAATTAQKDKVQAVRDAQLIRADLNKEVGGIAMAATPDNVLGSIRTINNRYPGALANVPFQRDPDGNILPNAANVAALNRYGLGTVNGAQQLERSIQLQNHADSIAQIEENRQSREEIAREGMQNRNQIAALNREAIVAQRGIQNQFRQDSLANNVRTSYQNDSTVKEFNEVKPYYMSQYRYLYTGQVDDKGNPIQRPSSDMDATSDAALRDAFLKMVHPNYKGSVYEQKDLERLAGLGTRMAVAIKNLAYGKELPNSVRYEMFNAMTRQFNELNQRQIETEDAARGQLSNIGVDPSVQDMYVRPQAVRATSKNVQSPVPAAAGNSQSGVSPRMTATNPKTGERLMSNDGGRTWQPLQ